MTATTRNQILDYLQAHETASAIELAHAMGMTIPNIRHHLAALLAGQAIEVVRPSSRAGRGRPTYRYQLIPRLMPHNLDRLCLALLETLLAGCPEAEQKVVIQRLVDHLAPRQLPGSAHLSQKLSQAIQELNQMKYQARWEAHADAPRVYFNHCPYQAILPGLPALCAIDSALLENLTGLPAFQATQIGSARSCLFYIGHSPKLS